MNHHRWLADAVCSHMPAGVHQLNSVIILDGSSLRLRVIDGHVLTVSGVSHGKEASYRVVVQRDVFSFIVCYFTLYGTHTVGVSHERTIATEVIVKLPSYYQLFTLIFMHRYGWQNNLKLYHIAQKWRSPNVDSPLLLR